MATIVTVALERSGPAIRAALAERAQLERAKAGDFTGLYARDDHGN